MQRGRDRGPVTPGARLRYTVEDTVGFLLEASHLRVLHHLRLGTRSASANDRNWEVCLSPVLRSGAGIDAIITSVVREHQRRRDEDFRDWGLMLTEYVGVKTVGSPARRCLRRVLLAFLHSGEDVIDAGCGACSGCCPDGNFLPLAERAERIIAIPPALWSCLEAIRKALDVLPDIQVLLTICAVLGREDGARWRHAVYLNTERMLREDSASAGATALMICLIANGWAHGGESDLHRLFDALWQQKATLGRGLERLAEVAAGARPGSVVLTYWRARTVHAEDAPAGLRCWRAFLEREGVAREHVHEAASALTTGGDSSYALLAARTSRDAEEARFAYARCGRWISAWLAFFWRSRLRSSMAWATTENALKPLSACSWPRWAAAPPVLMWWTFLTPAGRGSRRPSPTRPWYCCWRRCAATGGG